jgi:hypothetical protein
MPDEAMDRLLFCAADGIFIRCRHPEVLSEKQNGSGKENADRHGAGNRGIQPANGNDPSVSLLDHRRHRDFYQVGKLLTRSCPSGRHVGFSA